MDLASTGVLAVLAETRLTAGCDEGGRPVPVLGRIRFCALAPAAAA